MKSLLITSTLVLFFFLAKSESYLDCNKSPKRFFSKDYISSVEDRLDTLASRTDFRFYIDINYNKIDPTEFPQMDDDAKKQLQRILSIRNDEVYSKNKKLYQSTNKGILLTIDALLYKDVATDKLTQYTFAQIGYGTGFTNEFKDALNALAPDGNLVYKDDDAIAGNEAYLEYFIEQILSLIKEANKESRHIENFGPIVFYFDDKPEDQGRKGAYKYYHESQPEFSFLIESNALGSKKINFENIKVDLTYYKRAFKSAKLDYLDVKLTWNNVNGIDLGKLGQFDVILTALDLEINFENESTTEPYLNGTATLRIVSDEDVALTEVITLQKGISGDLTFNFMEGTNDFRGSYDFSNVQNIHLLLQKDDKLLATASGNFDQSGVFTGAFQLEEEASFPSGVATVALQALEGNVTYSAKDGLSMEALTGSMLLRNMRGIDGSIALDLSYHKQEGFRVVLASEQEELKAFGMTLTNPQWTLYIDEAWNVEEISGSVQATHPLFDSRLDIADFRIRHGTLQRFHTSADVTYKGFEFNLSEFSLSDNNLVISAQVVLNTTGRRQYLEVDEFMIDSVGGITVGSVSGNIVKGPLQLRFNAAFSESRFTGTFSGDVAKIGLAGTVDIGTQDDPSGDYFFAYLKVTAKSGMGIPIPGTGVKVTQIGGEAGYNYYLKFNNGSTSLSGEPRKGNYLIGLTLGVADQANLCEVVANPVVQFNSDRVELNLNGQVNIPRYDPMVEGQLAAHLVLPDGYFDGTFATHISIPKSSGALLQSDVSMSMGVGADKWYIKSNQLHTKLLSTVNFDGEVDISGSTQDASQYQGHLKGTVGYSFAYAVNERVELSGLELIDLRASVKLAFSGYAELDFDANHVSGGAGVDLVAAGALHLSVLNEFYEVDVMASGRFSGYVYFHNDYMEIDANGEVSFSLDGESIDYAFAIKEDVGV